MSVVQAPESEMLETVKTREFQRGVLAEMRGDQSEASLHLLAAAHLERVLADDYRRSGQDDLAFRSQLSAVTCFWRAGQASQALTLFSTLLQEYPHHAAAIQAAQAELNAHVSPSPIP